MVVTVSWSTPSQDVNLKGWRVYASMSDSERGQLVATAEPSARSATFEIAEGEYHFTVVPVSSSDVEGDWAKSKARTKTFITGRTQKAPDTPSNVAIQQVSPDVGARVAVDPLTQDQDAEKIQIIEGDDAATGKLVAEVEVPKLGPQEESASLPSVLVPLDGSDSGGATRQLQVRSVTRGGRAGVAASKTVVQPERAGMEGVVIAAVDTSGGGSLTNFPTPTGSDFYTHVAADGFKTTRWPKMNDAAGWNLLGAVGTGARFTTMKPAPYPTVVKIESDEVDLGANLVFVLECFDEVKRTSATGLFPSKPAWSLSSYKMAPSLVQAISDDNTMGPAWLFRTMMADGKCRRPIPMARWEYVSGTSASVAHADGDYKPIVPGAWISGRYVRVRLVIRDPLGWHQIKTGNIKVYARVHRVDRRGAGSPEASVTAPAGSRYLDTTNQLLYVKGSGTGNTGWVDVRGPAGRLVYTGSGSPEGVLDAAAGSLYLQTGSEPYGAWIKISAAGSSSGWILIGPPGFALGSKTASFAVAAAESTKLFLVDTTGGAVAVTMAAAVPARFTFGLHRSTGGANALAFAPAGQTVNGAASYSMPTQYESAWFTYVGSNVWVVSFASGRAGSVSAHATSHQSGGSDPIKLDDLAAPDDNTDLDVSTSKHGLTPKAPNDATKFLRGDASWQTAPGRLKARYVYTSGSGTHTPAAGVTLMRVRGRGAGGGGGGVDGVASQCAAAGGGGEGGEFDHLYTAPSGGYAYAVGALGAGGAAGNNPGTDGGDTTFGAYTAGGGKGGAGQAAALGTAWVQGGAGGACSGSPDIGESGATGMGGGHPSATTGKSGEGGGRGGGKCRASTGDGSGAGRAATGYGAGGGGAFAIDGSDYAGGDGSAGVIVVEEFY
jgi:hypothetical protein